jgi:hypothetical protein
MDMTVTVKRRSAALSSTYGQRVSRVVSERQTDLGIAAAPHTKTPTL